MLLKTRTAIVLTVFFLIPFVHSQELTEQNRSFIQARTGERIFGDVQYVHKITDGQYLVLDHSKRHYLIPGMAFQNENGYFAVVETKILKTTTIAKRIKSGRLDLFALNGHEKADFFSKGGGEVVPMDYKKLFNELSDNKASADYLNTYKRMNALTKILAIGGCFTVIYGLSKSYHEVTFIGIGIFPLSALTHYSNRNLLYKAIDCY